MDQCHCDDGYVDEDGTCVVAPAAPDCGEHGQVDGEGCACDEGYVEHNGVCIEGPPPECGGHGYLHDDHCHCDSGYVAEGATCVPQTEPECGGHGHLHGHHCHCDEGYVEEGGTCVPETEPECGGHGHLHGHHCHCDEGYVEDDGICVPETEPECGGHGHLHGSHCHCDEGYVEDDGICVPETEPECGGHGHLHGSHCHCDHGFVAEGTTCVPVTVDPLDPIEFEIHAIGFEGAASFGLALNDHRQVTGNLRTAVGEPLQAFLFDDGEITPLGVLPGSNNFSRGYAINNHGVIVGESDNNVSKAFRYENGTMSDLGTLGGASAVAHGINDDDVVVGISSNGTASRAFRRVDGTMAELPSLDGKTTTMSRAWSVNARGDAVGFSRNMANVTRATLWTAEGSVVNLGFLREGSLSWAYDLNDHQQVVGSAVVGATQSGTSIYNAFLWEDGVIRNLGTLPSLTAAIHSEAKSINNSGWAVGYVGSFYNAPTFGTAAAVLWRQGQVENLNDFLPDESGWELLSAEAINEHGDIVGYGRFNGTTTAYLLVRKD